MVKKALAFIFRNNDTELLCFTHPITGFKEVVRGTVDKGESPEETVIRELYEEAGIGKASIEKYSLLGLLNLQIPGGYDGKGELEDQTYYGYYVKLKDENISEWTHIVKSDGIDNGHQYTFLWEKYNNELLNIINPFTKKFLELYLNNEHE